MFPAEVRLWGEGNRDRPRARKESHSGARYPELRQCSIWLLQEGEGAAPAASASAPWAIPATSLLRGCYLARSSSEQRTALPELRRAPF